MDPYELRQIYESQLTEKFLPFWFRFVDETYGGICNCIANVGDQLLSGDKFTWSQGRWLWVLSSLYDLKNQGLLQEISGDDLRSWMDGTWNFLWPISLYLQWEEFWRKWYGSMGDK